MKTLSIILIATWSTALLCSAAITPSAPRKGLAPKEALPVPPPAPPKPASAPAPAVAAPVPAAPQKVDPLTPSAALLKDLSVIAQIHTDPAKAREAVGRCENLRTSLATYPKHLQQLCYYWAVGLANSGDLDSAAEKFALAASPSAPDQGLAIRALNEQTRFMLRSCEYIGKALTLAQGIVARTKENTLEQNTALYNAATAQFLLNAPAPAIVILGKIDTSLTAQAGNPEAFALKQHASNLLSALYAAKSAQNSESPPHVFHAPWRGIEITSELGIKRRIADFALIQRDFPQAENLYTALEKEASTRNSQEIEAWCRMQRGRILYMTNRLVESEKVLSTFLTASTFKNAKCAPFALLRLALLYHNHLKDIPKSISTFELCATRYRNTIEAAQCQYYRAMVPQLQNKPQEALPLLVAYTVDYPKHPQTQYLKEQFIPALQQQLQSNPTR